MANLAPLTPLALGSAALGNLFQRRTDAECEAIIHAALDAGVDHIDTAPLYGYGLAERRVGRALAQRKQKPALSTKVGRRLVDESITAPGGGDIFIGADPKAAIFDYSAVGVRASLQSSLQRLGVDRIDIVLMHDLGRLTHGADHGRHFRTAIEEGFPALEAMRREGVIDRIGVGVNETEIVKELVACAPIDVVLLAGRHTLLDRTAEQSGFFSLCGDRGISVMIGGVFNSGLLVDPEADDATFDYRPVRAEERDQARCWANHSARHGVALPAAALAFARARRDVTRVLVGPGSLAEWRQIQAWASAEVSAELFGLAL